MQHARSDYDNVQEITTNGTTRRIPADEPVFLIRGQDALGAAVVRKWASLAARAGVAGDMVAAALEHADKMEAWPVKKMPDAPAAAVNDEPTKPKAEFTGVNEVDADPGPLAAGSLNRASPGSSISVSVDFEWVTLPEQAGQPSRYGIRLTKSETRQDVVAAAGSSTTQSVKDYDEVKRLRDWIRRIDDATAHISSASIDTFANIRDAARDALSGKPPREIATVQIRVVDGSAAEDLAASDEWKPTHRHFKRGTSYRVLGDATFQLAKPWHGLDEVTIPSSLICEGHMVRVYQSEDGALYARFPEEFDDGRFEVIAQRQEETDHGAE